MFSQKAIKQSFKAITYAVKQSTLSLPLISILVSSIYLYFCLLYAQPA